MGLLVAMLLGQGQRGELEASLASREGWPSSTPGEQRSQWATPQGNQSLASNLYWQRQSGPKLAQYLSTSQCLTPPRLLHCPGCRRLAPALLRAPDTLPGQH